MGANEEGSSNGGGAPHPLGRKIPGYGPTPCDLMLIAEAGGVAEEKSGRPLVGKTGRETARYMSQARLVRLRGEYDYLGEHVYLTNVVKHRPFTRTLTGNNPPSPEEIRRDESELIEEIRRVQPKFIGAVGAVAARWLIGAQYGGMDENYGLPYRLSSKRAKQIGADSLPHRSWIIPLIHPAAGMHSPGTQPHIYDGFMRLGQYVRGELPLTVPVDPFTDPDYYEIKGSSVSLIRNRPVYIDTEGLLGSVWGLSFTQHAGSAGVIRVENKRAVRSIRDQLRGMTVVMHHAIHDVPILSEMFGMTIAQFLAHIKGFEDTMVKAYVLRMPPLALKPSCRRYLGMSMETYLDIVYDADREIAVDYLKRLLRTNICTKCGGAGEYVDRDRVSAKTGKALTPMVVTCGECEGDGTSLPDPEVTIEYVDGLPMLRRGHRIGKRVRGILKDMRVKPAETDPRGRWEGVDYQYRIKVEDVAGAMRPVSLNDVEPQERARDYSARDADATLRYDAVLEEMIDADPKSDRLRRVYDIDRDSLPLLMRMTEVGIKVDVPALRRLSVRLTEENANITQRLKRLAGRHINPASSKQVAEFLFDDLRLPPVALTKGGDESTADKVLEDLKLQVAEWPESAKKQKALDGMGLITDYRERVKLKGSYADKIPRMVDRDDRVHTTFRATTVESGRVSSADPGLQQIPDPSKGELGGLVRNAFIAPDGFVLVESDYSQMELRYSAHDSGDENMIRVYRNNEDIHAQTAARMFGIPIAQVTKKQRRAAKCVHPDTLVWTPNGPRTLRRLAAFSRDSDTLRPTKPGKVRVASPDGYTSVTHTYNGGTKRLVHIVARHGIITCTEEHKFLCADGRLVRAADLQLGETLVDPVPPLIDYDVPYRSLPVDISDFTPHLWEHPTHDHAYFAGLYVGDGCRSVGYAVALAHGDLGKSDVMGVAYEDWQDILYTASCKIGIAATRRSDAVTLGNKAVHRYLAGLGLVNETGKVLRVPDWIMDAGRTAIMHFLGGLYDTDGTADKRGYLSFTTKDAVFAGQVAALLTGMGFYTSSEACWNRTYHRYYYRVRLGTHSSKQLMEYMRHPGKVKRVQKSKLGRTWRKQNKVVAIVSAGKGPCLDVTVDTEDHLYVTNNFITHNTVNFSILYGITPPGLKARVRVETGLDVSVETAADWIDDWLNHLFPEMNGYFLDCYASARRYGYAEDMYGMRRYLPGMHSAISSVRAESERISVNHRVQGSCASIMKLSCPVLLDEVIPRVRKAGWDCDPLLTVHDAFVCQVKKGGEEMLMDLMGKAMTEQVELKVLLTVDSHAALSWGAMKG